MQYLPAQLIAFALPKGINTKGDSYSICVLDFYIVKWLLNNVSITNKKSGEKFLKQNRETKIYKMDDVRSMMYTTGMNCDYHGRKEQRYALFFAAYLA